MSGVEGSWVLWYSGIGVCPRQLGVGGVPMSLPVPWLWVAMSLFPQSTRVPVSPCVPVSTHGDVVDMISASPCLFLFLSLSLSWSQLVSWSLCPSLSCCCYQYPFQSQPLSLSCSHSHSLPLFLS